MPAAFLVCYDKSKCWTRKFDGKTSGEIDVSIVTTHMMMEATSLGLGSIWVMYWNPEIMKAEFEIPAQYEPVALLIVGYADKSVDPHKEHLLRKSIEEVLFNFLPQLSKRGIAELMYKKNLQTEEAI